MRDSLGRRIEVAVQVDLSRDGVHGGAGVRDELRVIDRLGQIAVAGQPAAVGLDPPPLPLAVVDRSRRGTL